MKSLEALENIKTRTAPYFLGLYEKEDYIEDLKTIEKDLKMVKFLKEHYGLTYYDPNNPYLYHMVINLSCNKEYEKLVKWLNENIL